MTEDQKLDPATILRYRAREHAARAEVALDACDFAEHQQQRSLARLEDRLAVERGAS